MMPDISVVILNWNNWQETLDCLKQLEDIAYPQEKLRVIVVDNGSTDDSISHLRGIAGSILVELPENLGFAGGTNAGIRHAMQSGCDYILLLNNDVVLTRDFIAPLLERLERNPRAGLASPKICYASQPSTLWYAGGKFHPPRILGELTGMGEPDSGQNDLPRQVDFAVGTCMLVRSQVFREIGLLDSRLFFYHEDVDFSYRALQAGYEVWYEPKSVILHKVSASTSANLPQRTYLDAQARTVFLRKHAHGLNAAPIAVLESIRFIRQVVGKLLGGQAAQAAAYARGVWSGLRSDMWAEGATAGLRERAGIPWKRLFGLGIALAIFSFLLYRAVQGIQELAATGLHFTPGNLLISLACQAVGVLLAGLMWSDILKRLGAKAGYWMDLKILVVTALARKIPGPVWYAVGRLAIYDQLQQPRVAVIVGLVVESITLAAGGLLTLGISIAMGDFLPAGIDRRLLLYGITPLVLAAATLGAPLAVRLVMRRFSRPEQGGTAAPAQPVRTWDMMRWQLGQSIVVMLAAGVAYFLLKSMDTSSQAPFSAVLGALSLAVVLGPFAVWLPADIGLKDGFMYLALSPWGSPGFAAVVTLAWRLWVSLMELTAGAAAFYSLQKQIQLSGLRPKRGTGDRIHD